MIKELTIFEFDKFAQSHVLKSYHQSSNYAILMAENDNYDYDLVGYIDETNHIVAASVILIKPIDSKYKYGYAPKGFLIDYYDHELLKKFTKALAEYYISKNINFIRINPEIAISELSKENDYLPIYNDNKNIIDFLTTIGYKRINQKYDFNYLIPKYNAIVNLKDFGLDSVTKNVRNKVKKSERQGLSLKRTTKDDISTLYEFIKNKKTRKLKYYIDYYNLFDKTNDSEIFIVKVNYQDFLVRTQERYNEELELNTYYNELLISNRSKVNLNLKMESDKVLHAIKNEIVFATNKIKNKKEDCIAAALVIKYANRIHFVISGFDKRFSELNPNHFMYFKIMDYYKNEFKFADLNGVTGNLKKESKFYGLNQFKLGFNPKIYEFIGEFDLILNTKHYEKLQKKGLLERHFKMSKMEKNN